MEIKKVTPEIREKLRAPLDPKAITKHPTKSYLSSIKGIYIVERLNEVFGVGSWSQRSTVVKEEKGMVVVHSRLTIPEYGIELESFGGNDNGGEGSKNFDLGDAYKGACTDAMSKMCSFLEIAIDVFKGNTTPVQTQQQTSTKQTDKNESKNPDKPSPLSPNLPLWKQLQDFLKMKNKNIEYWNSIRDKYEITKEDEEKFLSELNWDLPF